MGWYFLFAPIIATLKWIPLVGWLLSGVLAIAAGIFAIVVGLVISLLTIAIAWVFYRPLIGILLLTGVGIGLYFIFFFKSGEELEEEDDIDGTVDDDGGSIPSPSPVVTTAAQIASQIKSDTTLLAQKIASSMKHF